MSLIWLLYARMDPQAMVAQVAATAPPADGTAAKRDWLCFVMLSGVVLLMRSVPCTLRVDINQRFAKCCGVR